MCADASLESVLGEDFRVEPATHAGFSASRELRAHLDAWRTASASAAFTKVDGIDVEPMAQAVGSVMRMPMTRLISAGVLAVHVPSQPLFYPATEAEARKFIPESTVVITSLAGSSEAMSGYVSYLASVTNKFTSVALYCSRPDSAKFDWHIDNWVSFIVQVHGTKVFEIRDTRESVPQECVLGRGDGLVLGSLVKHRARTLSPSIHLSFSIHND